MGDGVELEVLRAKVAARRREVAALREAHPIGSLLISLPGSVGRIAPSGVVEDIGYSDTRVPALGLNVYTTLPEPHNAEVRALADRVLATGVPETFETKIVLQPHGDIRKYLTCYARDPRPGPPAIVYAAIEITELRRTREALRERTAEITAIMGAPGMGSFWFDAAGGRFRLDAASRARLVPVGDTFADSINVVAPEDRAAVRDVVQRVLATDEAVECEARLLTVEGPRWYFVRGRRVGPAQVVGVIVDISEDKALAEALGRARSTEAMGRFAAGIAHNFNNMLAAVLARLDLVLRDAPPALRPGLLASIDAGTAAAATVKELLRLVRPAAPGRREAGDLAAIVRRGVALARFAFAEGALADVSTEGAVAPARVDEAAVERLLLDLLVRLGARATRLDAIAVVAAEGGVVVRLTASAPIALDDAERTTLTRAVEASGGTRAAVTGPVLELAFVAVSPARVFSGDRRVLVVDDDEPVRLAIHRVLEDDGLLVRSVGDGRAALAALEAEPTALILLDLTMPGLAGHELVVALRKQVPRARILLFSGGQAPDELLRSVDGFLGKPVRIDELLRAVRTQLEGAA